jgi:hypothetical protein
MNFVIYNSTLLLNKICINNGIVDSLSSSIASNMSIATSTASVVSNAINDIKLTWKYMIYVSLIAFGIALISMIIIRYFAGVFVWLTLLIFIGCFFALAIKAG